METLGDDNGAAVEVEVEVEDRAASVVLAL